MFKFSPSTVGFYTQEFNGDNIPTDAIEITDEQHAQIKSDLDHGRLVKYDKKKKEFLITEPDPPSADVTIRLQIKELESQQNARRIREAALGIDNGWLADLDEQIVQLRDQL